MQNIIRVYIEIHVCGHILSCLFHYYWCLPSYYWCLPHCALLLRVHGGSEGAAPVLGGSSSHRVIESSSHQVIKSSSHQVIEPSLKASPLSGPNLAELLEVGEGSVHPELGRGVGVGEHLQYRVTPVHSSFSSSFSPAALVRPASWRCTRPWRWRSRRAA